MSSYEQSRSAEGLGKIILRNRDLCVAILPEAGGKIVELRDLRGGRNWLWRNPNIPFGCGQYDVDYASELDSGGWDELLLSVQPDDFRLADGNICHIPDHGDIVGRPWSVRELVSGADGETLCELAVAGRALQYEFRRTARLPRDGSCLHLAYSLSNEETFAWPWFWSAHALVALDADTLVELPDDQPFRLDHSTAQAGCSAVSEHRWPELTLSNGCKVDLSRGFDAPMPGGQFASKVFVRSPASGAVTISATGTNESMTMHFDPTELPWFGLWLNNGGWAGNGFDAYRNLGLEPSTTPYDSVREAVDNDAVSWIEPGETRRWSLMVELRS